MRTAGKITAGILIGVALSLLVTKALFLAVAWRHQAMAERLLAVVQELQPGVTTVDQLETIFAANREFHFQCDALADGPQASTDVENWPYHYGGFPVYSSFRKRKFFARLMPRPTFLQVQLMCAQGKLMSLTISEFQQDDDPLPVGHKALRNPYQTTTALLGEFPRDWWIVRAAPARHYWVFDSHEYDEEGMRLNAYEISLDRFATADERRRALDFDLGCFTRLSGCQHPNLTREPVVPNVRMGADGTTEVIDARNP